jgi:hypothetical protein
MATTKQIEAQKRWEKAYDQLLNDRAEDKHFEAVASSIAGELGLCWNWRWNDDLTVVWVDGDSRAYFTGTWHEMEAA